MCSNATSFYSRGGSKLYYEKHLLGQIKTQFLGRVARPLLVLAAKNAYLQGRVAKPPLKIGFLGRATPQLPLKFSGAGHAVTRPRKCISRGRSPHDPPLKMYFQGRAGGSPAPEILFPGSGHHLTRP